MKMTETDWIEVDKSSLNDTFVEISSILDEILRPIVVLKRSDSSYVKLTDENIFLSMTADNFTILLANGSWEINEPKAGKTLN